MTKPVRIKSEEDFALLEHPLARGSGHAGIRVYCGSMAGSMLAQNIYPMESVLSLLRKNDLDEADTNTQRAPLKAPKPRVNSTATRKVIRIGLGRPADSSVSIRTYGRTGPGLSVRLLNPLVTLYFGCHR